MHQSRDQNVDWARKANEALLHCLYSFFAIGDLQFHPQQMASVSFCAKLKSGNRPPPAQRAGPSGAGLVHMAAWLKTRLDQTICVEPRCSDPTASKSAGPTWRGVKRVPVTVTGAWAAAFAATLSEASTEPFFLVSLITLLIVYYIYMHNLNNGR